MSDGIWIIIIFFISIFFIIYILRIGNQYEELSKIKTTATNNNSELLNQINSLTKQNDYLNKVKTADEQIFDYIRCINIPRTPACKGVEDTGRPFDEASNVCRSRQIDCNKYKLVLENDPVAVERMKVATQQYVQANKPPNPSDLTGPVRSWWFF
jgi:hypothetical protein